MPSMLTDAQLNEALEKLIELQDNADQEMAHVEADAILRNLLTVLGYPEIVYEYSKIPKWYA